MSFDRKGRPLRHSAAKLSTEVLDILVRGGKRDHNALAVIEVQARHRSKELEETGNLREGFANIAYNHTYVVSKGPKALILVAIDDILKLPKQNVDANGKEDHRKRATLSDTSQDIGTTEGLSCYLDEMLIVPVELLKAIDESTVKPKERKTISQKLMREGGEGRREVEEKTSSKIRISNRKEMHKSVKKNDIVN